MGWVYFDESVEMIERRYQYLPHLFRWHGRFYDVVAVERSWTVVRRRGRHRLERRYFQVQCGDGTFELYQDLRTGTWHLRRAKAAPARVPVVRRLAFAWR